MIRFGDARALLRDLEPNSVQLVVTSPPYFSQRAYLPPGSDVDPSLEIGGGTLEGYLAALGNVLDGIDWALDARGSAWWVIGDSAIGSGGSGGDHTAGGKTPGSKQWIPPVGKTGSALGLRDGQWALVPYRFAAMAQARGWLVRSMVVWDKSPQVKPEDPRHIRRPMVSTERIVMLTRQVDVRWFPDRLVQPGDVWRIAPRRDRNAPRHYAPFPPEIPRRIILATTERGDTVLDPFCGTGTTVSVATELGRVGLGFELYPPVEA